MKKTFLCWLLAVTIFPVFGQLPVPLPAKSATGAPVVSPVVNAAGAAGAVSAPLNGYVADDTYKLRVGDTVSFQIIEDRKLGIQLTPVNLVVTDSGEVEVSYIGRIKAVGKTSKELATDIKAALEKDYYKQATVVLSLNLASRVLGRVYIWGQVHNQGPLDIQINENLTAGQAILRAGGLADFANKSKVKVVRAASGPNGEKQVFELNMQDILEKGKTEKDIVLQPDDFIIVPTRLINF